MTGVLNGLTRIVSGFFDLLVAPLAGHPAWAMLVVSVFSAVWALLLFKAVTPQKKLADGRDRLFGHIFEMGLYQDHLSVLGSIQRDLAKANLRYMMMTLPALLALTLPMVLTLAQLDSRFSRRPLHPGETAVFSVRLNSDANGRLKDFRLVVPDGVIIEAGPVRDQRDGAIAWRLRGDKDGEYLLQIMLDGRAVADRILPVGEGLPRVNEHNRVGPFAEVMAPGARSLKSDDPIGGMTLHLPERSTSYLGLEMNWLVAFMLFSLLGGLVLKDVLKVSL
ncbi:MAG: hypothetical protein KOO60_01900 [Gemmatimonadales bacterium]|nr:hypothetical protein [Gemmatimonadales bacterium]